MARCCASRRHCCFRMIFPLLKSSPARRPLRVSTCPFDLVLPVEYQAYADNQDDAAKDLHYRRRFTQNQQSP